MNAKPNSAVTIHHEETFEDDGPEEVHEGICRLVVGEECHRIQIEFARDDPGCPRGYNPCPVDRTIGFRVCVVKSGHDT